MPEDPDERIAVLIRIAYCAALALALCAGAAYGQDRPKSLREVLEGYPGWMAMPVQQFPHIPQTQQIPQPPPNLTVSQISVSVPSGAAWATRERRGESGHQSPSFARRKRSF
jgi:hypothetical protein